MKNAWGSLVVMCLALVLVFPARADEDVTAEDMGQFYPTQWEEDTLVKRAFSNMEIPGHQKAFSSQYYAFGLVEFIYYSPQDSVYSRRADKLKAKDKKHEEVEISGYPAVVFTRNRVIANLGGEILAYFECYTCESREDLMARFEKIDLAGLGGLLGH